MRILAEHGRGPRGEITEEIRAAGSFIQSQRLELYREAFRKLKAAEMIYPCVCSRRDIEAAQSAPHAGDEIKYANTCRDRFADEKEAEVECGKSPAWRFWVSEEFDRNSFVDGFYGLRASCLSEWSGDFVIARGESLPSYQLAVVVDDAAMGVTEVVRAEDLLPSTHRQLAFYKALGLNAPEFYHLPLVVGEDGRRLAKRHGDTRLSHIREAGTRPETVLGWLAHTCGWAEWGEEVGADELLKRYDPQTIPSGRVAVDEKVREHFGVG
jgi:glutamyl-tRNA synthetase